MAAMTSGETQQLEDASGEGESVGLEKEDAMNRTRWRVGVGEIAVRVQ